MDEKTLIDRALDALKSGGAEGDAFLEERRSLHLVVREGKLAEISRASIRGIGVRAIRDGRLGFVHASAVDPDGVARAAQKACELALSASPRDDLVLAEPAGPGGGVDEGEALKLYDPSIERKEIPEKQDWARSAEAVARGVDPRIARTDGASYDEDLSASWIGNTRGLFRHYSKSHLEVGVHVVAVDKDEMQPGEQDVEATRWDELPEPGELGRRAGERAIRLLGAKPVATGRYPIVFSPDAGFALLVYLSAALSGDNLSRGRSWIAHREGDAPLGSPLFTVHDDGRLAAGPAAVPYDGEGVDTRDTVLLDKGRIRDSLRDLAAAKRLHLPPTGNAGRTGYEQLPAIASHNLYLEPGAAKPDEVIAHAETGLWVWGLSGWWIGLDPSNPEFSSAAYGLMIQDGKPAQPVAQVTIAGPLEHIFSMVSEVANDLVWDHPTKTPTFRVASMSVSGV